MQIDHSWKQTFINAFNGCSYAFKTQKNFKVHFTISILVILLATWLNLSLEKWLFLILAIFLGLTMEMTNTAFEKTVDLMIKEFHPDAKIAKDVSAGMMLIVCLGLALIGLIILLPPLLVRLGL